MDEMYEITHQTKSRFLGIDEAYQIGDVLNVQNWPISYRVWIRILQIFHCLRCKIINFVLLVTTNLMPLFWLFGLCVCVLLFGMYQILTISFIKLGCLRCRCGMKENILNFVLSALCLVYIKFLMPSIIKLGFKRCVGWKWWVDIFLLLLKMSRLRCFCCAIKFLVSWVIKIRL